MLLLAVLAVSVRSGGDQTATPTRQEARDAAQQYAQLLGGKKMFADAARDRLLADIVSPDKRASLQQQMRESYRSLNAQIGVDRHGRPPAGMTLVSRTMPAKATIVDGAGDREQAVVDVWCTGLFGLTGSGSEEEVPVKSDWFTMTMHLEWHGERTEWLLARVDQSPGPDPSEADQSQLD